MAISVQELSLFNSDLSDVVQGLSPVEDGVALFPELDIPERGESVNNNLKDWDRIVKSGTVVLKETDATEDQLVNYFSCSRRNKTVSTSNWVKSQSRLTKQSINPGLSPSHSECSDDYEDFDPETIALGLEHSSSTDGRLSMSKNAISARENRQKKKKYINGLEKSVKELSGENHHLKSKVTKLQNNVDTLEEEVVYLKSVLANQSTLSMLLKNISSTPGVQFSSSLMSRPGGDGSNSKVTSSKTRAKHRVVRNRMACVVPVNGNDQIASSDEEEIFKKQRLDHDYASNGSILPTEQPKNSAGVCLHVSDRNVSLEFCATCNAKSSVATLPRKQPMPTR